MPQDSGKLAGGFLLLIAIWIGVYWWWEPRESTRISFADREPQPAEPDDPVAAPGPPELQPEPRPAPKPPASPPDQPLEVIAPEFKDYTIQRGDSLQAISRRFYGTSRHAAAIARANPLMDADKLRPGRVIRVPVDPTNIQGKPGPGAGTRPKVAPAQPPASTAATTPTASGVAREYVVQSGDSLSSIAKKFLGKASLADVIFQANRDRLSSPDDVREGTTLRIPAKPE